MVRIVIFGDEVDIIDSIKNQRKLDLLRLVYRDMWLACMEARIRRIPSVEEALARLPAALIRANRRIVWIGDGRDWRTADRSSAGLLPPASAHLVFAARTVRWRGIFAVHAWIVVKEKDAPT